MRSYVIASLMILVCGYAIAMPDQINSTIADIKLNVQYFESKATVLRH